MKKISKTLEQALKQRIADREAKKTPKPIKGLPEPEEVKPGSRIVHDPTSGAVSHGGKMRY